MKLIVGLGNPSAQYEGTRHNMGFSVIDILAEQLGTTVKKSECRALTGSTFYKGEKILLAKPMTYMNLSGESIRPLMDYYNVDISDLLVIVDDIYLAVGNLRARASGTDGGHNGLKDIIRHLGSNGFARIRVGVGDPGREDLKNFVLGHFNSANREMADEGRRLAADAALCFIESGIAETMNRYNGLRKREVNGTI